jgi:hypothetical protein
VEHKLYWAPVDSVEEGRYLCAILNSQALAEAVAPLQSVGQFGARDFDMYVFALPFPMFDADDAEHQHIAELAATAEEVAADVSLDQAWGFQKVRRIVREALAETGASGEINEAVTTLLRPAAEVVRAAPDEVLAAAKG